MGVKTMKGIDYVRNLPVDKLAKVLIRSCPSDIGLNNLDECPNINCVLCWINALESEIDEAKMDLDIRIRTGFVRKHSH